MIGWALLSAVLGWGMLAFAARRADAGLPLLLGGLLLALVVRALSVPHCPACGKGLWLRGERPGPPTAPVPTRVERERRCPRCGAGFAD